VQDLEKTIDDLSWGFEYNQIFDLKRGIEFKIGNGRDRGTSLNNQITFLNPLTEGNVNSMKDVSAKILISDIFLDESIYPRENIDHKRVGIFVENLRDGFVFEPIKVQACPDTGTAAEKGKYRILDGVHRWSAYKKTGVTQIDVVIKTLNNIEPILYAAKMAIGPRQLTEAETRNTAPGR
jgi:hypothetical protein